MTKPMWRLRRLEEGCPLNVMVPCRFMCLHRQRKTAVSAPHQVPGQHFSAFVCCFPAPQQHYSNLLPSSITLLTLPNS